jgi:hypothetical protein
MTAEVAAKKESKKSKKSKEPADSEAVVSMETAVAGSDHSTNCDYCELTTMTVEAATKKESKKSKKKSKDQ